MVVHEGDIVETWNDSTQWGRADRSMSLIINADIPLTMAPGDHNHEGETPDGSTEFFYQTFPESRFDDDPWWGGDHNDNTNHYVRVRPLKRIVTLCRACWSNRSAAVCAANGVGRADGPRRATSPR